MAESNNEYSSRGEYYRWLRTQNPEDRMIGYEKEKTEREIASEKNRDHNQQHYNDGF